MTLPHFRYHPDPLLTGLIEVSDEVCIVCKQARGYIYASSVHTKNEEYLDCICPWCIADGRAHEVLGVVFNRMEDIGPTGADFACQGILDDNAAEIPAEVLEEVAYRTPGIRTWQSEYWLTHCGDAAVFINAVGYDELKRMDKSATAGIRDCLSWYPNKAWKNLLLVLDRTYSPRAYLFQCRHCGRYLGYVDWSGISPPTCGWRVFGFLWPMPPLCRFLFLLRRSSRRGRIKMYSYPRKALRRLEKAQQRKIG